MEEDDRHPYVLRSYAEEKAWAFKHARLLRAIRKRSITLRNQEQSPLLRLPREVRDRIFELAFEDEAAVHIEFKKIKITDPDFYGALTKSKISFTEQLAAGTPPTAMQPCHRACKHLNHQAAQGTSSLALTHPDHKDMCGKEMDPYLWHKLGFGALEVCKQIYSESRLLRYSTITFVVRDTYSWNHFLSNCLTTAQRSAVRKLHLLPFVEGIGLGYMGVRLSRFFERTNLEDLTRLHHLGVSFVLGRYWWSYFFNELKSLDMEKDSPSSVLMHCALGLTMPSIETVSVSISDPESLGPGDAPLEWTPQERVAWTKQAEARILQDLKMSPEASAADLAKTVPKSTGRVLIF
ncbi:hypothetical protein K490DRAFT_55628 [Saccharata proteae CBS 121410]|uniref:DUF7730 domain-containing protein n=1 Tax=Saccharata proteae CBS 121410 TaxID=1314787 RepID=A0A6A5YBE2_9PEZI|nr:hypothetical protein K490DRAFT_55628 [Saccharata proteae CBS 121410]